MAFVAPLPFGNSGDEEAPRLGSARLLTGGRLDSTLPRGHPSHAAPHRLGGPWAAAGAAAAAR
ncbi:hypothetical protein ACP70R_035953 [Stipagrostis hirtigluma subsp. patula]